MMQIVLIGLGAGAASALLFASIVSGSPLSFALANFAQLPIMLAAIGWTHMAGLLAAVIASFGLAVATTGSVALAFLLGIGLPAWWVGYPALPGRPAPRAGPVGVGWDPVGRVVVWRAVAADRADELPAVRRDRAGNRGRRHIPAGCDRPCQRRVHREPDACLCAARLRGAAHDYARAQRPRLHAHCALFHRRPVRLADR